MPDKPRMAPGRRSRLALETGALGHHGRGAPLGESPSLGQSCPIGSGQALASYVSTDGSLKCGFAQRNL